EQAELLKVRDGEIESLKAKLLLKEAEAAEAIRLRAEVFKFKAAEKSLQGEVHELEISSAGLQEKVAAYEDFIGQLEKFQDTKIEEVNEKFDKLWVAISKAVEKGMQEGLSARITHGAEGRNELKLQRITHLSKLIICLPYNVFRMLGLTESQPHANQLMVPIHHSLDQRVVGASALSLSLDVSHSRVRKIRENVASHVSALRGVFVPLSEPLSAATLEGGAGVDDETAAVGNIVLFPDVINAELNILE
nr:hypothetical protein [Tanacetum cinerariifolium]